MKLTIFQSERDAGLEAKLLATAALAYCVPLGVPLGVATDGNVETTSIASTPQFVQATNQDQSDLHYLNTILVTTGWNRNDDVFDVVETWLARATPEDKPFNLEHDCSNIIGHITGCSAFDVDMKSIDNGITDLGELPAKFHVVTGAVLYKVWSKPELQERMDVLLEEISKGEWYVSMEAMFYGFDYAMKDANGATRVIARNEETAFLTKYLRAYGGSGKYAEYTVGRVLRSICFCGKGLVRKPANPESLILDDTTIFDGRVAASEIPTNFEEKLLIPEIVVYSEITQGSGIELLESEQMKTVEELTALVAERDATIASMTVEAATSTKSLEAKLSSVTEKLAELNMASAADATAKEGLALESKQLKLEVDAAKTSLATANEELGQMKAATKRVERMSAVATALKMSNDNSAKLVDATVALSDEAFASHVELMAQTIASLTPTPVAAKQEVAVEDDKADVNAGLGQLENVSASTSAVTVPTETSEVSTVRASIAEYMKK